MDAVSRSEGQWHCQGQEGEGTLQPDACHWRTSSENAAAGSELEEFFARGLIPRWRLAGVLGRLYWTQGQGMCQQQELTLPTSLAVKVPLGFDPLTLVLAGPDWVSLGLLQQRDGLSLLTSSHSPLLWTNVSPSYLFCRTPSKSYDEGDPGPGVHRIQDQGSLRQTTLVGHPT